MPADSTALRERTPTEPDRKPVGRSDSLINAAAPRLMPWVEMWRKADPEFAPESLRFVDAAPAFRGYVQPLKGLYPPTREQQPTFQILSARSPDRRYNLIFDWYLVIEGLGDEVDISGEPDSAPLLLDLQGGTSNQFDTCGTPCGFSWGVWLSPKVFALAGWEDDEVKGQRSRGRLKIYSLADSSATTYVTRFVPLDGRSRYQAAWESWVDSKFRALNKRKLLGYSRVP